MLRSSAKQAAQGHHESRVSTACSCSQQNECLPQHQSMRRSEHQSTVQAHADKQAIRNTLCSRPTARKSRGGIRVRFYESLQKIAGRDRRAHLEVAEPVEHPPGSSDQALLPRLICFCTLAGQGNWRQSSLGFSQRPCIVPRQYGLGCTGAGSLCTQRAWVQISAAAILLFFAVFWAGCKAGSTSGARSA